MSNRPVAAVCSSIEPIDGVALRTWRAEDAASLVEAWNDNEIGRWNPVPPDASIEFAQAWIAGAAVQATDDVGIDVLMDRSGTLIGEIGLQVNREQRIAELGFWIGEAHRGQGLGSTMLQLAVGLGEALELRGLVALVDPANGRTIRLLSGASWDELPTRSSRRAFAVRF